MLRAELAKRLGLQRSQLEDSRRALVRENPMSKALEEMGGVVNSMKRVEGEILHAEVGYSGISADIKIKDDELNRLYEYDNSMIESLNFIDEALIKVPEMVEVRERRGPAHRRGDHAQQGGWTGEPLQAPQGGHHRNGAVSK